MLELQKYSVTLPSGKTIIKDITFTINIGEKLLILGNNGAGKSSLAMSMMGLGEYRSSGEFRLDGKTLMNKSIDERAKAGLFLVQQTPPILEGVNILQFISSVMQNFGKTVSLWELADQISEYAVQLGLPENIIDRDVNYGFSGGEKKKLEILQMLIFTPRYVILDEVDSGVDIASIKTIWSVIKNKSANMGLIMISHNPTIIDNIKFDQVIVMKEDQKIAYGDMTLAQEFFKQDE